MAGGMAAGRLLLLGLRVSFGLSFLLRLEGAEEGREWLGDGSDALGDGRDGGMGSDGLSNTL